jgi:lipid-A-disaccharide synthase
MYPEYIQGAATADALSLELKRCLRDIQRQLDTRINAERLRLTLRQPAAGTAADWLVHHLD